MSSKGKHWKKTAEQIRNHSNSLRGRPTWNKGKKGLQKSHRKGKSNLAIKGEKHWNWQGGITGENHGLRNSLEYKIWREAVFERDNYMCIWCGARNGSGKTVILNADHIKPFALFPELRFAIDNGRTLCRPCHITTFKGIKKSC